MVTQKDFNLTIFELLKNGKNPAKISKELNISLPRISFYLRKFEKEGLIIKEGYGSWRVIKEVKVDTKYGKNLKPDFIRGHAFIFKIIFHRKLRCWNNRIELLRKNGIDFKLVGLTKNIPQIIVLGRKVWLCKDNIRIFERKENSFYADSSIESRKKAYVNCLNIIRKLENTLKMSFKGATVDICREHYSLIKNGLAIHCNKNKEKIRVKDEKGEWLIVDDSLEQGGELETIGKKALINNKNLQSWWNDNKKHNFEVTPTFILNSMNGIMNNQLVFDKNMASHIDVIKKMGEAVDELRKEIRSLNNAKKMS